MGCALVVQNLIAVSISIHHHPTIKLLLRFHIAFYSVKVTKEEEIKVAEIWVQKKIW